MYKIDDLFDFRNVVGKKISQLIDSRGYTKSDVCQRAKISRPTFDKLLSGEISNKTNFEKHILKLLNLFELTPDSFMSKIDNPYCEFKKICQAQKADLQSLSEKSGVSIEDLKRLEAGENLSLSQLRDIAFCLETTVSGILGKEYFQTQIASYDGVVLNDSDDICSPGGFWGHLGIRTRGQSSYMWFPISLYTRQLIYNNCSGDFIVVPCMNNVLLIIKCSSIEDIILVDDACDQSENADWDISVDCGDIPSVIYEAFPDYYELKGSNGKPSEYNLSDKSVSRFDYFVEANNIDIDAFYCELNTVRVIFESGRIKEYHLSNYNYENLAFAVQHVYEMGELFGNEPIDFLDEYCNEILINLNNVSIMKLPLAKMNAEIYKNIEAILKESQ